ncbi:uncharacterized protein C22orf15 homolog [Myotis myotis]|uniref:uncharacterized protein C22orf15 homolog n=1 Tax=Myotis myotis TaxID=51298 RepID=UPI00174CF16B|nr:uncharacterized protein C22orf15 homolog [Myotis myotis]
MFITVMFGAGCRELVNPWCSLVTLTAHLRQRGRVPPDATIALLAEDGHLVSLGSDLEEGASQAPSSGSPLLQERGTYVLVRVIPPPPTDGEGGAPTRYESLLENLDARCPELAAGGDVLALALALGVATRTKALLRGPKGWAPCCPGPASGGQKPGSGPDRQQPSSIPLTKPGITELYLQEAQGHRQAVRLLGTPPMWAQRQERWRGRHPWESRQLGIPAPRARRLLGHLLMPHCPL